VAAGKRYVGSMNVVDVSEAGKKLDRLLGETVTGHEPLLITSPAANAVLIGEEDWNAIQETLHLLSIPGMRESIREGLATPVEQCEREPGW
jgi:antitoxin YefM